MKAIWITIFCGYSLIVFGQTDFPNGDLPPDAEGCWAKCAIGTVYDIEDFYLPVLLGKSIGPMKNI